MIYVKVIAAGLLASVAASAADPARFAQAQLRVDAPLAASSISAMRPMMIGILLIVLLMVLLIILRFRASSHE